MVLESGQRVIDELEAHVSVDVDEHLLGDAQRPQAERADQIPSGAELVCADARLAPAVLREAASVSSGFVEVQEELLIAGGQLARDVALKQVVHLFPSRRKAQRLLHGDFVLPAHLRRRMVPLDAASQSASTER